MEEIVTKFEQMEKIENSGIVAIIRNDTNHDLIQVVDAIHSGGIDVVEITMTTPGALDTVDSVTKRCQLSAIFFITHIRSIDGSGTRNILSFKIS